MNPRITLVVDGIDNMSELDQLTKMIDSSSARAHVHKTYLGDVDDKYRELHRVFQIVASGAVLKTPVQVRQITGGTRLFYRHTYPGGAIYTDTEDLVQAEKFYFTLEDMETTEGATHVVTGT